MKRTQKRYYPVVSANVDDTYQCAMIPTTNKRTADAEFTAYLEEISHSIFRLKSKATFKSQTIIACPRCGNALSIYTKSYGSDFTEALCRCDTCKQDEKSIIRRK